MSAQTDPIIVVGGGPAGLMAAEIMARAGRRVVIHDAMPSLGRKFLMAGRGGLNLTHDEPLERFLTRFGPVTENLRPALESLPPAALRQWSEELGQPTFVGTSGRIFPKSFKSSPLLRAWLGRLAMLGVETRTRHRFEGFDPEGRVLFATPEDHIVQAAAATILALGGASWPRLGSNGGWASVLAARGVSLAPFKPSNCGFDIAWSEPIRSRFAGAPLKSIELTFEGHRVRGEAMVTANGIEGGAIYALSSPLRDAIMARGVATLVIDLKPDLSEGDLAARLSRPRAGQSTATFLRKAAGLSPLAIALLREPGPLPVMPEELARRIKGLSLNLVDVRPLDRAISTAGGVAFEGIDEHFMLRDLPGVFVAGEMLDWEAPTGGYLLQACFATGAAAGRGALRWLESAGR
jgi:uncharacterized flavoprotein (TIGR03862 family)